MPQMSLAMALMLLSVVSLVIMIHSELLVRNVEPMVHSAGFRSTPTRPNVPAHHLTCEKSQYM